MAGQWLTADEQRAWRAYLRAGTLLRARLNRQLQADSGLSLPECEVLMQLSEAPGGRLRPFQLGAALHWEQSRPTEPAVRPYPGSLLAHVSPMACQFPRRCAARLRSRGGWSGTRYWTSSAIRRLSGRGPRLAGRGPGLLASADSGEGVPILA